MDRFIDEQVSFSAALSLLKNKQFGESKTCRPNVSGANVISAKSLRVVSTDLPQNS